MDYAFECLEICKQSSAKKYGVNYQYFTSGGAYGYEGQWAQIDSCLALCRYKWKDWKFCETTLFNFIGLQLEDGRICLWATDVIPSVVAEVNFPNQTQNLSSLFKIFDVAYPILSSSTDKQMKEKNYIMLKNYIDWWFSY